MNRLHGAALAALLAISTTHAMADTNVALGGAVSYAGSGFGSFSSQWGTGALAVANTVTDGAFLPLSQQWNIGTLFWIGNDNAVTITLNNLSSVNRFYLQVDNNDDYGIEYRDSLGGWNNLTVVSPHRSWGMDFGAASLSAPVVTDAFRVRAVNGDGYYSISEFQAFGSVTPVPEAESYAMMLAGLGMIGWIARRRKS